MEMRDLKVFMLHALAAQLQHWADLVLRQTGEQAHSLRRNQVSSEAIGTREDNFRVSSSLPAPLTKTPVFKKDGEHVDPDNVLAPPADWLAKVRKSTPEWLKLEGHSPQRAVMQAHLPLVTQARANMRTDAAREARTSVILPAKEDASELVERDTQAVEENPAGLSEVVSVEERQEVKAIQQTRHDFFAIHDSSIGGQAFVTNNKSKGREPVQASVSEHYHVKWGEQQLLKGPEMGDPWKSVAERALHHGLQTNIAESAHDYQSLNNVGEQVKSAMHWPSLPDVETANHQSLDWEMARRIWERQQRLDDEQRGNSWNA